MNKAYIPDLRGVTAEEVQLRRKLFTERLAGCPLERWLANRRPKELWHGGGQQYVQCTCACH